MNRFESGYYYPWVIDAREPRSLGFNEGWLERAKCAQSFFDDVRSCRDLRSACEQCPVLARCNIAHLASDVINSVVSEGHYCPMMKSPEIEPFALLKLLRFFKGDGPEIAMRLPSDINAEVLRAATKRVPRLVRELRAHVAAQKMFQI